MRSFDAVVIGGGVLGCFAARNLSRYALKIALVEAESDVCTGITRANAAVIYAGYDHAPGTVKETMTVAANAAMEALCDELEVYFLRRGGLMTATGAKGEAMLRKKLSQGLAKSVPGLRLLSGSEARALEPMLSETVTSALYSPTTGTVNPWQLGIAAFENAVHNGVTPLLNTPIRGISRGDRGYILETDGEDISCKAVLNCAGLYADRVQAMLFPQRVTLQWDSAEFLVLDKQAEAPGHILFQERESGKGITAVTTVEGNLMLVSPALPLTGAPFATTREGQLLLRQLGTELLPNLDFRETIRSFAAVRPNPRTLDGQNIRSFVIDAPEPGFRSLIGIKTPGLTCADQLGTLLAGQTAAYLDAPQKHRFDSCRAAIPRFSSAMDKAAFASQSPAARRIVCQCGHITEAEIREAVARGASTVDGIKRRTGTCMGPCQGSRCRIEIEKLLRQRRI